jgi:hypothetical protein
MRGYAEFVNVLAGQAANVNGKTVISDPLPVGEGWYRAQIRIGLVFVVGTGTTPIAEGELNFIKNVLFKTDRGEIVCNLPGRALDKIAAYKAGINAPRKDAIAAASATYYVNLPIYFAAHYTEMDRPEDTILDTKRYSSVTLEIQLGTVADLLTTVGTSSVTCTIDMEIVRTKGLLPEKGQPTGIIAYDYRNPVDAAVAQQVFLERAADLSYKYLYVHSATAGTAGVPFSGVNADTIQNLVSIKDQNGFITKDRVHRMIQESNQVDFSLESIMTGMEVHDFVQEGSTQAALATVGKTLLQYQWTNQGGVGANSLITVAHEGIRGLK